MIDLNKAKSAFKHYISQFDLADDKINRKIIHTYKVVECAKYIAENLKLSQEDIELAQLIGLLHDIGRFEQAKKFDDFRDAYTIDHAELGVQILFEENLIRSFIQETQYDKMIKKSIRNHNKLKIESGLTEKELLHSKIIRDADKLDNFRVKEEDKLEEILYLWDIEQIENSTITEKVYQDFMKSQSIINTDRVTPMDYWISYMAFLFDLNFDISVKYILEKDYIHTNMAKIKCKNKETEEKMKMVTKHALEYARNRGVCVPLDGTLPVIKRGGACKPSFSPLFL